MLSWIPLTGAATLLYLHPQRLGALGGAWLKQVHADRIEVFVKRRLNPARSFACHPQVCADFEIGGVELLRCAAFEYEVESLGRWGLEPPVTGSDLEAALLAVAGEEPPVRVCAESGRFALYMTGVGESSDDSIHLCDQRWVSCEFRVPVPRRSGSERRPSAGQQQFAIPVLDR